MGYPGIQVTTTRTYGATNGAGTDPLASFFRYDLFVSPNSYCTTHVLGIAPGSGSVGSTVTATVTCDALQAGPNLAVKLSKSGSSDIVGSAVTLLDSTHVQAKFNLTGATKTAYNVVVTNGCGGNPGVGVGMFTVTGGWGISIQGPLPAPLTTDNGKEFTVVSSGPKKGVYYWYTTDNVSDFELTSIRLIIQPMVRMYAQCPIRTEARQAGSYS